MKPHHQGQECSLHALQGQTKTKACFLVGKIPWAKREPCSLWCGNRLFLGSGACRALGKGFCSEEGLRALHSTQLVPWAAARRCLQGFTLFFFFSPSLVGCLEHESNALSSSPCLLQNAPGRDLKPPNALKMSWKNAACAIWEGAEQPAPAEVKVTE